MGASIEIRPFGFDRIFRQQEAVEDEVVQSPELLDRIAALQAEIDRLKRSHVNQLVDARRESFEAALAEARGEREAAVLAAIDALHAALEDADQRLERAAQDMREDAGEAVLAAAEAIAGHALQAQPTRAIDEALGRVLDQIGRGAQLRIRVNSAQVADVEQLVEVRASKERRKLVISVIPDDDMPQGDARIFWDDGGLAVERAARHAAVLEEMAPLLGERIKS